MDWKTFVAALVTALAWPLTLLAVVLMMRRPLLALLPSARRFKLSELEIEFDQKVRELAGEAQALAPSGGEPAVPRERLRDLAETMPTVAVLDAWREVEAKAVAALARAGLPFEGSGEAPYKRLQEELIDASLLDVKGAKLFEELRRLRNKVAHAEGFEVTRVQARQYVDVALRLHAALGLAPAAARR